MNEKYKRLLHKQYRVFITTDRRIRQPFHQRVHNCYMADRSSPHKFSILSSWVEVATPDQFEQEFSHDEIMEMFK